MKIDVTCDDCGRDFRVNEASAGRTVRCTCGARVQVPDDDDDDVPVRRSGPRRKKQGSGNNGAIIGLIVGGGFGLLMLVLIVAFALRSSAPLPAPPGPSQTGPVTPNNMPIVPTPTTPTTPRPAPHAAPGTAKTSPTTPTTPTTPAAPTAPAATKPAVAAAPPSTTRWYPLESKSQIGHEGQDATMAIAPGGKFVEVDRDIYDTATGDKAWTPAPAFGGGDKKALRAVSPDGDAYAEGSETAQQLFVYFKESAGGEPKAELPTIKGAAKLVFLQFADEKRLIAGFNSGNNTRVAVYSIDKPKKSIKDFATDTFSGKTAAISPDGKFLAIASFQALRVYDLAKGVSVATMAAPANGQAAFASCSGIAFSPDNEELAAVLGTGVLIWSNRGKLLEEHGGAVSSAPFSKHNGMAYLPDKSALLVNGQDLFDRKTNMVVWQLKAANFYNHPSGVFDAEHIIVSGGSNKNGQVAVAKIPREELAKAAAAIESKVDSVIAPGAPISVQYEIGEPRFANRQDVANQLHAALTARLTQLGITVADDQPTIMKVLYTEAQGDVQEYGEGFGFRPPPRFRSPLEKPGVKVVETKHHFVATLVRKNDTKTWWTATIDQGSPQTIRGDVSDSNIRNASFEQVKGRIGGLDLPRFLPVDPNIPSLPLKSDLNGL